MKKVQIGLWLGMLVVFGAQFLDMGSPFVASARAETLAPETQAPSVGGRSVLHSVSYGGREFLNAFNAAKDRTRLVLVFSPT